MHEERVRVAVCAPPRVGTCAALVAGTLVHPRLHPQLCGHTSRPHGRPARGGVARRHLCPSLHRDLRRVGRPRARAPSFPQLYCAAAAVGRTVPPREEGAFATWGPRPCDPIGSGGATVAVDGQAPPPPLRGGAAGEAGVTAPPWSPRHLRSGRFAVRASDGRTAPPSCGSLVAHRPRCGHSRASLVAARRPRFVAAPPLPEGRVHCSRPCRGGAVFPRIVSVAARFSRLVSLFSGRPYCRRGWGPSPLASAARVEAALPWILGGRTASAAVVQTASLRAAAQNGSRSVWSRAPLWSTCCWWLFRATLG